MIRVCRNSRETVRVFIVRRLGTFLGLHGSGGRLVRARRRHSGRFRVCRITDSITTEIMTGFSSIPLGCSSSNLLWSSFRKALLSLKTINSCSAPHLFVRTILRVSPVCMRIVASPDAPLKPSWYASSSTSFTSKANSSPRNTYECHKNEQAI